MKTNTQFIGLRKQAEWEHFEWSISINEVSFTYKTGVGHSTKFYNTYGKRNPRPACESHPHSELWLWVHVPQIDDVLECLFSDAQLGQESFDHFCDNLGYSNDSIKAFDSYRQCMETAVKLKKALGPEFLEQQARIEALRQS